MFKNYLTVAIRNLARHKAYTFINVIGLAIGLTCSTLILLYIQHEFSYDRHHSKADRIYRVVTALRQPDGDIWYGPGGPYQLASTLSEDYPEIERATWLIHRPTVNVGTQGKESLTSDVVVADGDFFNVFDFPLLQGNVETGLQNPFSIFITQMLAQKLFDNDNPIGKTITLKSKWFDDTYTITGILKDIPETSIAPLRPQLITKTLSRNLSRNFALNRQMSKQRGSWGLKGHPKTYILLNPSVSASTLEQKLADFTQRHLSDEQARDARFELMPLTQLHLHGKQKYGFSWLGGNINTVYTFGLIGIFIIVVACINFMNLSTARSARRMREVGMRKVVGAKRGQLVYQFLGESILLSLLSLVFALGLAELTLPMLNGYLNIALSLQFAFLPILFGLVLCVGLLAGSYPAIFLSSFRPSSVLKMTRNTKGGQAYVRKGLVILQFAISMVLIATTIIVFQQTNYMRTADLGFKQDALIHLPLIAPEPRPIKAQFLQHVGVRHATSQHAQVGWEGDVDRRSVSAQGLDAPMTIHWKLVDHDFLDTYQIPLLSGHNFTTQDYRDRVNAFFPNGLKVLLNETAARQLNVQPGDRIEVRGISREVIGIVKDFHNRSLHGAIRPLMLFCLRYENQAAISLRIDTKNLPDVMAHLKSVWNKFLPGYAFEFVFADDYMNQYYQAEQKQAQLYAISSGLAIAIACLGLLGLIAYTAEVRTKEIGIRKVLGATEVSIVNLLTKEFLLLVGLASLLAWPVAYYTMGGWLENFAYRIDLSPTYFIVSTGVALIITLITIAYQALKAARANPVEALRYE